MQKVKDYIKTLKRVYSNKTSVAIFIIIVLLFYTLNVVIANYKNIFSFYDQFGLIQSIKLFYKIALSFLSTLPVHSSIGLVILTMLTGIFFSLVYYKTKQIEEMERGRSFLGAIGVAFGIIASGCASCGIGLAGLVGAGTILAVLPFEGFEITVIAIILLCISVISITRKIKNNVCKIDIHKMKGGKSK